MAMAAPPMSQQSSFAGMTQADSASFDLPPMPVPYEDFHFSLDLPDNLDASDLSLLEGSTDFQGLFGTSSAMHTPSIVSGSALFQSSTPLIRTPAPLVPQTPVPPPHAEDQTSSSAAAASQHDDAMLNGMQLDAPASSNPILRAGPPPPPDFGPPPGSGGATFSFDSLFSGAQPSQGTGSLEHSQYSHQHRQQNQGHYQQHQPLQQQPYPHGLVGMPMSVDHSRQSHQPQSAKGTLSEPVQPLFEPSESDFLSNFLEGFESSWDFNPTLPDNMPSFAAAAAQQVAAYGYTGAEARTPTSVGSGGTVVTPRGPNGNGNRRSKSAKKSNLTGPADNQHLQHPASSIDSTFAAFGGHLNEIEEDEELEGGAASLGSKRSYSHSRIGEPKRRGSLAHLDGGKSTAGGHMAWSNSAGLQGHDGSSSRVTHNLPESHPHPQPQPQHIPSSQPRYPPLPSAYKNLSTARTQENQTDSESGGDTSTPSKDNSATRRDLLTDKEKRQNHIMSEQRRRNHIREGFAELVSLLDLGRSYGARGLGLSSGAGTGIEDEGLDDRTDVSSDEESDPEAAAIAKARRKKARAKRNALLAAAAAAAGGKVGDSTGASRGRGKGRGRGGSAGGGAGSKSAVLFQAVDLVKWLEARNEAISEECRILEEAAGLGSGPVSTTTISTTTTGGGAMEGIIVTSTDPANTSTPTPTPTSASGAAATATTDGIASSGNSKVLAAA